MPGVYVSYPFCAQKCTYCNFASGVFPEARIAPYLEELRAAIRAHVWQWQPDTLYVGGGTPSSLDPAALASVLDCIPGHPWGEATLEAAPGTITAEKALAWARMGIDRVSLGVQSFVETELRRTGRKHSAAVVARDVEILRSCGLSNINIDLIAGLSAQTEASWHESLDWIERLAPPHVSVYMLEIDEDSRLGKELLLGGIRYGAADVPSEEQTATLYEIAVERLARLDIPRYEISNFARPGWESRHNLKYWTQKPYVGFGEDASSGGSPARPDERFFVGLRLMRGIQPTPEEWRQFEQPIHRFLEAGLLETADGVLRLTNRGVLLSNEVFQEFLIA